MCEWLVYKRVRSLVEWPFQGKQGMFVIMRQKYYHLLSTVKRERFSAFFFSNVTVSQTLSTGPMKMFCLDRETMNVCQRNVACFAHVECRFDKIRDIFQGFGSLMSLQQVNKFG